MKISWNVQALNRVRASKSFFALNQNTFSVPTVREAWRFGVMRTLPSVTFAVRKLVDLKRSSLV